MRKILSRTFTLGECLGWWGVALLIALMGAHFYRAYEYGMAACAGGMILFLFSQSAWKHYAVGLFLLWGALEWADTARILATVRMQMGASWLRGAAILAAVGAVTALGGWHAIKRGKKFNEAESGNAASGLNKPTKRAGLDEQAGQVRLPGPEEQTALLGLTCQNEHDEQDGPAKRTELCKRTGLDKKAGLSEQTSPALFQAVIFMLTFLLLFFIRQKAQTNLLLLERFFPVIGAAQIFLASWYAAFVAGKLINPRSSRKTRRRIWLLFALVFFGQFALGLLGVPHMLMTGQLHVPIPGFIIYAPFFRGSFSMMPLMAAVVVLLAGSSWCSLLCYYGGFDAATSGISHKAPRPAPRFFALALKYGRLAVLIIGVLAAFGLRLAGADTELAISAAIGFAAISLGVMLLVSRRYGSMAHCTAFCPFGLLVNLFSRLSPWRIKVSADCNNCGACEKVCLYRAITAESRAKGGVNQRCSLCRDCMGVCGKKAIRLHSPLLPARYVTTVFVGLITILHVLFLNLARV